MSEESMKLPQGMCCGSCALFKKCEKIFGCNPTSQECDFYPVRFAVSPSRFLQECSESDRLRARVAKLEGELKEARTLVSIKDDALASMVEIYEKIQTYLGIDPGDMGKRADGEILHRIHKLHIAESLVGPLRSDLEQARAKIAEWKSLDDYRADFFRNAVGTVSLEHIVARWNELVARIAELESARRWVPVGDRLPEPGQTVYGWVHPHSYVPGNGKEVTYMPMLNPDYPWRSTWDMATYSTIDITHWRPLPAGPMVDHE